MWGKEIIIALDMKTARGKIGSEPGLTRLEIGQ